MASGVTVHDDVLTIFNDMKLQKTQITEEEKKRRKKAILFCIEDVDIHQNGKKVPMIVPEKDKEILLGDMGTTVVDPYDKFVKMLPCDDCRYALYDASYETKETKKQELVFMMWAPDCAHLKKKMLYASSKDAIKKKFTGIKHEWQVNDFCDLKDRSSLVSKLGAGVISFEGSPC